MSPYTLFAILIGGAYGAAFHIWKGKNVADILYYCTAGIIGFTLGQFLANFFGWTLLLVGPIHILEASVTAWVALFLARWLRV